MKHKSSKLPLSGTLTIGGLKSQTKPVKAASLKAKVKAARKSSGVPDYAKKGTKTKGGSIWANVPKKTGKVYEQT